MGKRSYHQKSHLHKVKRNKISFFKPADEKNPLGTLPLASWLDQRLPMPINYTQFKKQSKHICRKVALMKLQEKSKIDWQEWRKGHGLIPCESAFTENKETSETYLDSEDITLIDFQKKISSEHRRTEKYPSTSRINNTVRMHGYPGDP